MCDVVCWLCAGRSVERSYLLYEISRGVRAQYAPPFYGVVLRYL